jgi:hypothetical protein
MVTKYFFIFVKLYKVEVALTVYRSQYVLFGKAI